MSSTASHSKDDSGDHIIRPRALRPRNPMVLRAQSETQSLVADGGTDAPSALSSGRTTPIPPDAPPSVQSLSSAKKQIRAQQQKRLFPTVEYSTRVSHFDPKSDHKDFKGFFVLFWISLAIMVMTTVLRNIKDTGLPFRIRPWGLLTANTWQLGLSDLAMVVSTGISIPLQGVFRRSKGVLRWANLGMALQSCFQLAWLGLWIKWPFMLNWTWTAQVFFTLHTLVLLMKMHSYAFYNGHLSTTEYRLHALDQPETASTAAAIRYPSSTSQVNDTSREAEEAQEADKKEALARLRQDLAIELISPLGQVSFPQNLTYGNYIDYILCPTLCYELQYPRTPRIQWVELFWKTLAIFGCIFLLTIISEEFIVPVLNESAIRLENATKWTDIGLILAENISHLLFPFMVTFLLVFLVIFEYVLGAFAEITCFADRRFYSDWWNGSDWLEFSRSWNLPVHNFLHRHIYSVSLPYMSRGMATLLTFLVSALLHELVMGCITKKLRGYGFVAMMLQIPIVALQRSPLIRGRPLFNVSFDALSLHLWALMMTTERMLLDINDFRAVTDVFTLRVDVDRGRRAADDVKRYMGLASNLTQEQLYCLDAAL